MLKKRNKKRDKERKRKEGRKREERKKYGSYLQRWKFAGFIFRTLTHSLHFRED